MSLHNAMSVWDRRREGEPREQTLPSLNDGSEFNRHNRCDAKSNFANHLAGHHDTGLPAEYFEQHGDPLTAFELLLKNRF